MLKQGTEIIQRLACLFKSFNIIRVFLKVSLEIYTNLHLATENPNTVYLKITVSSSS